MSLPTLLHSIHSPIYSPQWILYCQYTSKGDCTPVSLSRSCYWSSQIQCICLDRVEATRIIGKHEPSGMLLAKRSSHASVGRFCDRHRTRDLPDSRPIFKTHLLRVKQVAFKVSDASGTTPETRTAALCAERLRKVD